MWWRDTVYTDVRLKNFSMYFVPIMQREPSDKDPIENDISLYAGTIVLETARPMSEMEAIARKTLAGINPNLTVVKFQTFDEQIADRFTEERLVSRLDDAIWRTGAAAGKHRALWRHRLQCCAAHSRDRRKDGAGGGAFGA